MSADERVSAAREKHIAFFSVLEALANSPGCALCELELSDLGRHLRGLLHENVNAPRIRADLARSKGYCNRHGQMLLRFKDGLGTAILYQDQVEQALEFLDSLAPAAALKAKLKTAGGAWKRHPDCSACRFQEQVRKLYIQVLIEGLADDRMRAAFENSAGLCMPHLLQVLQASGSRPLSKRLIEIEREKFSKLMEQLREYRRKHDYRYSGETFGSEADSWRRAVEMIAGKGGLF